MNPQSTVMLRSGAKMPIMGLGTWQLTTDSTETIKQAFQLGYYMVDTSGDYGTQAAVGEAIRICGTPRNKFFVVTKVEETDDAYEATRKNLEEMGMDHVDLILIHRPPIVGAGQELWKGLIRAKNDGLAKDIGVSNYTIGRIQELADITGEMPAVNQIEWSPFGHSSDMLDYCRENNIILQAYSPLTRATRLGDDTLVRMAASYNKTPAQLLIRWNLQLGTVPIPKANQLEHLEENINVFDFEISPDDMITLDSLNESYSALGGLPYL